MEIRRVTTAETPSGVATQTDDVLDSAHAQVTDVVNIWGFDQIPDLPVTSEQVLGDYECLGIFGPPGAVRVDVIVLPTEPGEVPADLSETVGKLDLGTGGGMVPGEEGAGMHRTDTIDLIMVLEGETNVAYPSESGGEHEITIRAGDFLTHNGTFHRWHNRSQATCTLLCIPFAATRKPS